MDFVYLFEKLFIYFGLDFKQCIMHLEYQWIRIMAIESEFFLVQQQKYENKSIRSIKQLAGK